MSLSGPIVPLSPSGPVPRVHLLFPPFASPVALVAAQARPVSAPSSPLRYLCLANLRPLPLSRHLTPNLLPAITPSGVACLLLPVHFCPLSLPSLVIHRCLPLVGFTYALF